MNVDIDTVSAALESASPAEIVRWAGEAFAEGCVAPVSLQSPVLPYLVASHAPDVPLVFIDTGYHFPETWEYLRTLEQRLGVSIQVIGASLPRDDRWRFDPDGCCEARKVQPLTELLTQRIAFISGVRRVDHRGRADARTIAWDGRFGAYRVQPLAALTDTEVEDIIKSHDLPRHPLNAQGYPSIGCWPCTSPVAEGEDPRAGRWRGQDKNECGINHLYETKAT